MKKTFLFLAALCFCAFVNKAVGQTWYIGTPNAADITATFNNGTLTISGTGKMLNWQDYQSTPWKNVKDDIRFVVINEGVKTIGNMAFSDCGNLTSITISKSVTNIGDYAFQITGLTEIHIENPTPPTVGWACFWAVDVAQCKLYVPSGTESLYAATLDWCLFDIVGCDDVCKNLFVQESKHIRLEIFRPYLSISPDQVTVWLSCLDRMYEQYVDLMSGLTPYGGNKEKIRSEITGGWATTGFDYIRWTPSYIPETLDAFVNNGDWSFGILHEMGHSFGVFGGFGSGNNSYNWNEELFANFRMYLALTKVPDGKVVDGLGRIQSGVEMADYCKEDYDLKMSGEREMDEGIAMWGLIRLGVYYQQNNDQGYWLYKQAFAKINALPYEDDICLSKWQKFSIFLDILSSCAGSDVRETFPAGELDLIKSLMGGDTSSSPWQIGSPNTTDVTATLDNSTFTINGTGAMVDWGENGQRPPWCSIKENITNVIVSNDITTIGVYAFIDCINLISINIGKDVNSIKGAALWNCPSLTEIHCNNPIPPNVDNSDVFWGVNRNSCKVYVPAGTEDAYKSADVWKDFNILVDNKTGIIDVEAATFIIFPNPAKDEIFIKSELKINKVEIYSLTGSLLLMENNFNGKIVISTLPKGVYMLRIYTDNGLVIRKVMKE